MFKGILNAMNFIHILLSLLLVHVATAQPGHSFGDSHGHFLSKRSPSAPGGDGICHTYIIQEHDTCASLAERYKVTTSNIETWNVGSWGWPGCARLKQGDFACLSSGALPMPVSLPNAVCGPQVPGTQRPAKYSDLASLNPCPSSQCCAKSGQCVPPPSKTTTSVAPTQTWQMSVYSKDTCEGDYFTVQGHEDQHAAACIVLTDDTNTKISDSTTSCRWWSDAGLNWGTCSSGKLTKPKSWYIKSGKCAMFSGKKCVDEDWIGETYPPFKGCQSGRTGFMSPGKGKTWGAVQCYEMKSSGA
ncbi:hypothetical protein N7527_008632 [Penicillium freii]|uniref:LysM domain-containing protein n=1 Tax=Penicillium freii TaxID=48697 RepID=A0A124GRB7_PENFR|nr:hypothetical protein N7527_008632 [Penicillium freii]KUM60786.1 hypothetical protein ACN42_g6338 [Penicillium freii]